MTSQALGLLFSFAAGYLIGSVPAPYLIVRAAAGIDLRARGTGNVGVMNAGSALGRRGFLVVLAVELVKGIVAALAGNWIAGPQGAWMAVISAVVGANWSAWLGWSGGRGNTVFVGGLIVVAPPLLLSLVIVWLAARAVLGSAFRATRFNIYTLPVQIALWSWASEPRELLAFEVVSGLALTCIFVSRHRKDTDDHIALRAKSQGGA